MTPDTTPCEWHAGADRYTGDVPAAIRAYGFPIATQSQLIDAWERRQFVDMVMIDRDSIRGQAGEYAPDTRDMHYGSKGRRCSTVTRADWKPEQVEAALVVCAGGECIAIPAVCTNVARITRLGETVAPPAEPGLPPAAYIEPGSPLGAPPETPTGYGEPAQPGVTYGPPPTVFVPGPPVFVSGGPLPAPVTPVPEPAVWAVLIAGFAAIAAFRRGRK